MSYLARWNDFFFSKTMSLFDWLGIGIISNLAAHENGWWFALIFAWIPLSYHLTERFTIKKD